VKGPQETRFIVWLSFAQLVAGGTLYYGFTVMVGPMERELGWSKPEIYGALTLGLAVSSLASFPVGAWIDRHGGFLPLTLGAFVGGVSMIAWGFVQTQTQFYLLWAVMGVVFACALYEPAFAVVAANVADWRRGILVMTLIGGFSITIFIPLMHYASAAFGWRETLMGLGAVNATFTAAVNYRCLRHARVKGVEAEAADRDANGSALVAALRRPAFWGLGFTYLAYNFVVGVVTFHLIGLLGERGVDPDTIVLVWATIGPMHVVGRVVLMALGRRIDARTTGRVALGCLLAAIALLAAGIQTVVPLLVFAIVYGAGNGILTIVRGTIVPDLFGPRDYATVNGALAFPFNAARALAPAAAAGLWQLSGGYTGVTIVLVATLAAAFVAMWLVTIRK
jgi:MFS family permease